MVTQHLFGLQKNDNLAMVANLSWSTKLIQNEQNQKLETRHSRGLFNDNYDIVLNQLRSSADVDLTNKERAIIQRSDL